jgi:hypothetical protein
MSTEERPSGEERAGRTGEPEHRQIFSDRPNDSDAGAGPNGAEDEDDEEDGDDGEDTNDVDDPTVEPGEPI